MNVRLTPPDVLRDPPAQWVAVGGIALAVVALPVGNIQVPGLGTALILPATAAACVVTAMVLFAARRPLVVPSAVLAFAGGDVAVTAIAVLRAGDPAVALRLTLTATAGLVLAVLTAAVCSSVRFWYGLLGVLLAVGAAVCLASLNSALSLQASFGGAVVTGRLTGVFGQPNELGGFAAIVTVLAVGVLVTTRRIAVVVGILLVLASAIAALGLSLSRGSWIGVVAGIAVLAIALPQARRRLTVIAAAATLILVGVAVVSPGPSAAPRTGVMAIVVDRAASVLGPDSNPFDERPSIWREALRQIESSPVLGQGPGNFPLRAKVSSSAAPGLQAGHAHNLALTTAAETGLLGLAFLVCTVVAGVVAVGRVLRAPERGNRHGAATAAAALTVVLGQGLVDYPLRNAVLATLTWLLIGLLAAATTSPPPGAQRSSGSVHDPPELAVGSYRG